MVTEQGTFNIWCPLCKKETKAETVTEYREVITGSKRGRLFQYTDKVIGFEVVCKTCVNSLGLFDTEELAQEAFKWGLCK